MVRGEGEVAGERLFAVGAFARVARGTVVIHDHFGRWAIEIIQLAAVDSPPEGAANADCEHDR
jgi:hypothetical protein